MEIWWKEMLEVYEMWQLPVKLLLITETTTSEWGFVTLKQDLASLLSVLISSSEFLDLQNRGLFDVTTWRYQFQELEGRIALDKSRGFVKMRDTEMGGTDSASEPSFSSPPSSQGSEYVDEYINNKLRRKSKGFKKEGIRNAPEANAEFRKKSLLFILT